MNASRSFGLICLALAIGAATARADVTLERAARAGELSPGDVVEAWERRDPSGTVLASGILAHPMDLALLSIEQIPRGGVRLRSGDRWVEVPRSPDLAGRLEAAAPSSEDPSETARDRAWRAAIAARAARTASDPEVPRRAREELDAAAAQADLTIADRAWVELERTRLLYQRNEPAAALASAEKGLQTLADDRQWPMLRAEFGYEIGTARMQLGELPAADAQQASVLVALRATSPGSLLESRVLQGRGIIADLSGRLADAEAYSNEALELARRLDRPIHTMLNSLGIIARTRGDAAAAERHYLAAIDQETDARGRAMYRGNLANLYMGRGEVERARSLLREIVAGYDPAAADVAFARAAALSSLATAERRLGELGPAEEHVRQALAIHEGRAPESLGALHARNVLGSVLQAQKRWPEATAMHLRALETAERTAPASATASETLAHLGAVALGSGSLEEAQRRYAAALELQRAIAPGTRQEAEWLHALGNVSAARGRGDEAIDRWLEAIAVLDGLRGRLGGPVEAGAGFTSLYHELYWAPLDALAARGRAKEAYLLSERFRAQAFLASLAGRDLDLAVDLSPELDRERRRLAALYDATLRRVRTASGPLDSPARAQLRTELDQVRAQREENEGRVVAASPRQAALRLPHPADAVATLAALPTRTLMLAYVLGPERSWLFVLGPQKRPVAAIQLPTGLPEFHRAVTEFRRLADHPGTREAGRLELAGATLSRLLLAPAAERLRDADHLLVVPDGPLHLLPWAALPEPGPAIAGAASAEPLVARRAVSLAVSATALRELRAATPKGARQLVAFGDPLPAAAGADLPPLSGSRDEVAQVGELFGKRSSVFVGAEATEARLLAEAPTATRLHLACHAVVDPALPLESGLVLSPASGNGLLQVWEIYERLRMSADLVTLSACDTALGREMGGEGILGLTRAFHFAGARSVIGSLWKVSDRSTTDLMTAFYRHLLAGASKSEALRRAQLELWRGTDRHPFHWAGFQLHGSWD